MENKENSNQRVKNIARWIAVLPVSVAGIFIGTIAMNIFFLIQGWFLGINIESGWAKITYFIVAPATGAVFAVYWGSITAPKARKVVSVAMGAVVVIFHTASVILAFVVQNPDAFWTIASGVVSIIAAGYVVHQFFIEGDNYKMFD